MVGCGGWRECTPGLRVEVRDRFLELAFSFHLVVPRDWNQVFSAAEPSQQQPLTQFVSVSKGRYVTQCSTACYQGYASLYWTTKQYSKVKTKTSLPVLEPRKKRGQELHALVADCWGQFLRVRPWDGCCTANSSGSPAAKQVTQFSVHATMIWLSQQEMKESQVFRQLTKTGSFMLSCRL